MKSLGLIGALSLLAGCAAYTLVDARSTTIGGFYTVEPQVAWASTDAGKIETWTIDGFVLQRLRFFKGIEDGEALFPIGARQGEPPRFRASMTAIELADFLVDALFEGRAKPQNVRPHDFGGKSGLRFDSSYLTRSGLEVRALVVGAVINNRLHLVVYEGAAMHYFDKHREHVERLLASIKLQ